MKNVFAAIVLLVCVSPAFAADVERTGTLHVDRVIPRALLRASAGIQPMAVDALAIYSNISNFSGQVFSNGGSANQAGNQITRLVADDVTFTTNPGVSNVTTVRFSVYNGDAAAVSARPRIRIWRNDGAGGAPGTYYNDGVGNIGYSFNAISFSPGVTTLTGNLGTGFAVPAGATTTLWLGVTFDDNTGATGATQAQMDLLGQGMFGPVDLGTSADTYFETTAAGSFFTTSNPAGALANFGGTPLAAFGWELVVTTLPVELQSFGVD